MRVLPWLSKEVVHALDSLFAAEDLAVTFYDLDFHVVYTNGAMPYAGDVPRAALLGHTLAEKVPTLSLAITPALVEVRDTHLPVRDRRFHDGTRTWLVSYHPVHDANGEMIAIGAIGKDDTTWVRMQRLLVQSEGRYRAVIETCPDAIVEIERERITLANRAALTLVGVGQARSLIGRSIWQFVFPDDLPGAKAAYAGTVTSGGTAHFEGRLRRVDGSAVRVHVHSAFYDATRPGLAQAVVRDVTEEHRAAELLRQAHDDLEHRVAERTASLAAAYDRVRDEAAERERAQRQLVATERLASIGTLAAGMAHEINNPLAAILATAELARALAAEPGAAAQLDSVLARIIADARRGGDIVKRLLTFAREPSPTRGPVEVNDIVRQACDGLAGRIPIVLRLGHDVPAVSMSAVELEQIVVNLVENARHAHATRVQVTTSARDDHAVLRVDDDGDGIPAPDRARIFDPFFTTRQHAGGTGLGLSVVHGIVSRHEGKVRVRSVEGRGTVFTVVVPAATAQQRPLAVSR